MLITLIVDSYLPSTKAAAKLTADLASEFLRLGHSVVVLTASDAIHDPCEIERQGALTVMRARTGRIKGASNVLRAVNEVRLSPVMWRSLAPQLRAIKADLVVCYSPSIFLGPLVQRLKRLWGARSYLVLRDIFPDWAVDAGLLKRGLIYRYFKYCELRNYAVADRIGVEAAANIDYFNSLNPERHYPVEVLYSWTAGQAVPMATGHWRERLGLQDKVVLFFGGNIGIAQDMDNLLRLAKDLQSHSQAYFLFVGEGSEVSRVQSAIDQEGLRNVTLHPAVTQGEYLAMLQEFDIGLLSLDRRLKSANIPGKMLGYMECGLPILASVNPGNDLLVLLNAAGAGLASVNGEREQLCRDALQMINDAAHRREMGCRSRQLLEEHFQVRVAARQILELHCAKSAARHGTLSAQQLSDMRADLR